MARPELVVEFRPGASPLYDPIGYIDLPGASGAYASTPDRTGLDITGDLDVRAEVTLTDWAPAADSAIAAKWVASGNQRSWRFYLSTDGTLGLEWSSAGTSGTVLSAESTVPVDPPEDGHLAVRAMIDVNVLSAGREIHFYTARSVDGPWIQLGAPVEAVGTTSIFSSSAAVEIGSSDGGTDALLTGRVHALEVRNGIDGSVVAAADVRELPSGTTTFEDDASSSDDWAINGDAEIVGPEGVAWVSLSEGGPHGRRVLSPARWKVGRERDDTDIVPGTATVVLKNDDRLFDPDNENGTYYGQLLPRVPFRIRAKGPGIGLRLAASGDTAAVPDFADLDITGDLDIRAHLAADDWTPGGFGGVIASKWLTTGNQQSWFLGVLPTGILRLAVSTTGSNSIASDSTVALGFENGTAHWVRATLDANNGASGHTVTFYTSLDGRTWTQLGDQVVTSGTVTMFSSSASLVVGDIDSGGLPLTGWYHHLEIRSGIGGNVVVSAPFDANPDADVFTDDTGITWALEGDAEWAEPADQFYGYVQGGWEQDQQPPRASTCTVQLIDLLGTLAGETLPGVFDAAVQQFNPVGYWRLDTGQSEEIRDLGSGGNDGAVVGSPEFRDDSLFPGVSGLAVFNEDEDTDRIDITRSKLLQDEFHATIVAIFRTSVTAEATSIHPLFAQSDGNGPSTNDALILYVGTATARLDYSVAGDAAFSFVGPDVSDGEPHIIFGQSNTGSIIDYGIAVDSATLSQTQSTAFYQGGNGAAIGGTPNAAPGYDDNYFEGEIGAVIVYDGPLTTDARQAIIDALDALDGQRSDQHVAWVLDQLGVPERLRNLDEGRAIMGWADTAGREALDYLRTVTTTEQGALHIDHRDGGKVRFRERYAPWLADRSATSQFTVSDDPSASDVARAEAGSLDVEPNGVDTITNRWAVRWREGEEVVDDAASRRAYGPRGDSIDTEATTAGQARALGQFKLAQTKEPRTIIRGLQLRPGAHEDAFPAAIGIRLGDRLTYRSQPLATGSVIERDFQVAGYAHEVHDLDWTVELFTDTAPSAHQQLFTLGTSELDGTDVLGV